MTEAHYPRGWGTTTARRTFYIRRTFYRRRKDIDHGLHDLTPIVPFIIGFFVLAAISGLLAVAAVVDLVVSNRRTRLARRQSVRSYYRGLSLSH